MILPGLFEGKEEAEEEEEEEEEEEVDADADVDVDVDEVEKGVGDSSNNAGDLLKEGDAFGFSPSVARKDVISDLRVPLLLPFDGMCLPLPVMITRGSAIGTRSEHMSPRTCMMAALATARGNLWRSIV